MNLGRKRLHVVVIVFIYQIYKVAHPSNNGVDSTIIILQFTGLVCRPQLVVKK